MNKKIIWLSALALSMSISQATLACDCKVSATHKDHFEQMTAKLDLNADQKEKIKEISAKAREEMKPKFMELRENRMKLNELASAKELDKDKIEQLINQNKDIMGSLMNIRIATRHEINMVLNDKQKARLDTMISNWKEKHMARDAD